MHKGRFPPTAHITLFKFALDTYLGSTGLKPEEWIFPPCWSSLLTSKIILRNGCELVEFNPRSEWELSKKYVGNYTKEWPWDWVNALCFCSHEICVPGWRTQKEKPIGFTHVEKPRFMLQH